MPLTLRHGPLGNLEKPSGCRVVCDHWRKARPITARQAKPSRGRWPHHARSRGHATTADTIAGRGGEVAHRQCEEYRMKRKHQVKRALIVATFAALLGNSAFAQNAGTSSALGIGTTSPLGTTGSGSTL